MPVEEKLIATGEAATVKNRGESPLLKKQLSNLRWYPSIYHTFPLENQYSGLLVSTSLVQKHLLS